MKYASSRFASKRCEHGKTVAAVAVSVGNIWLLAWISIVMIGG
jgi:hypothetical protein